MVQTADATSARGDAPRGAAGSEALQRRLALLIFIVATGLYASTTAWSFVPGDPAKYLNLGHNGGLPDRGNGLPLYITLLNAVIHAPSALPLSDGVRANLLTVLLASAGLGVFHLAAFRLTRSGAGSLLATVTLMLSGLVWSNTAWIMPHVSMLLVGALFLYYFAGYEQSRSPRTAGMNGLICGLGFGLMPNALLFAPLAALQPILRARARRDWRSAGAVLMGLSIGIAANAAIIAIHESIRPTFAVDGKSVLWSTIFYLRGGQEAGWVAQGISSMQLLRACSSLAMEIAADFELFGSALTLLGLIIGLRSRRRVHLLLLGAFAIFSLWSGIYPGDTRLLHGLGAYALAGGWLACGAAWCMRRVPAAPTLTLGVALLLLLANIAVGKLSYRDAFCASDRWFLSGWCRERIPERKGDVHLRLARESIDRIPEGALVFGAAWDSNEQMKYLMRIRNERPDLTGPYDLTKLDVEQFLALAKPAWERGQAVFLFGDWHDVPDWSPHLLPYFRSTAHGETVFQLEPAADDAGAP